MGFTTGFTGGVALTLSVAYLSVLAHQRNREHQGAILRAQALSIQSLIDPLPAPLPPTRSEVAAAQRATSVEVAKDRWNHEVENAVRWAQNTDWEEVREGVEGGISSLWAKLFGETPAEHADKVKTGAQAAGGSVAATARDAYEKAKTRTLSVEEAAENKILEARLRTERKVSKEVSKAEDAAKDKADEVKGTLASAWESGKGVAKDIATRAKAAVAVAEDKIEIKADGKLTPPLTPVQKALHQRYERPEAKVNKTVADVLRERYVPLNDRDNTVLRGV